MTNRATLEALLARVLEGKGLDRELDAEIACAVNGFTMHEDSNPADGHFAFWHGKPWESLCSNCSDWPPYTASLDAALMLVPEGWSWHVALRLWPAPTRVTGSVWSESIDGSKLFYVDAATPARALIAACLKARMEVQPLSNP